MRARGELDSLAQAKARVRARIAARREDCLIALTALNTPLQWADLVFTCTRQLMPLLRNSRAMIKLAGAARTSFRNRGGFRIERWLEATALAVRAGRFLRGEIDWWIAATMC